jgi:aminodeoxyfutalosine deaminase
MFDGVGTRLTVGDDDVLNFVFRCAHAAEPVPDKAAHVPQRVGSGGKAPVLCQIARNDGGVPQPPNIETRASGDSAMMARVTYPKIELHVHLEGTLRPETLLSVAHCNDVTLPADSPEGLAELFRFTDLPHFIDVWLMVTACLRTADDFRRITVDYAGQAAEHGAVYIEGIFAPLQLVRRGVAWEKIYEGFCDGIQEAREVHGIEMRLTPDMTRNGSPEEIDDTLRYSIAYRDRGVVGLGLGAFELEYPPHLYTEPFRRAREGGLAPVPHAGELGGPETVLDAIHLLQAQRIRHGIRAIEDPDVVSELADRGTVLDVCPTSNVRLGIVPSWEEHPIRPLVAAGVRCSLSTDDPPLFDTNLTLEYDQAYRLGLDPRTFYEAGIAGALCDERTKAGLTAIGEAYDWSQLASLGEAALG